MQVSFNKRAKTFSDPDVTDVSMIISSGGGIETLIAH